MWLYLTTYVHSDKVLVSIYYIKHLYYNESNVRFICYPQHPNLYIYLFKKMCLTPWPWPWYWKNGSPGTWSIKQWPFEDLTISSKVPLGLPLIIYLVWAESVVTFFKISHEKEKIITYINQTLISFFFFFKHTIRFKLIMFHFKMITIYHQGFHFYAGDIWSQSLASDKLNKPKPNIFLPILELQHGRKITTV